MPINITVSFTKTVFIYVRESDKNYKLKRMELMAQQLHDSMDPWMDQICSEQLHTTALFI